MSGFECLPLADLVLDDKMRGNQDDDEVWNLNLDQIEPDSGRILEKIRVPPNKLGPSTYPFTAGTVLYSKLRPYLNKVVVADEDGFATTELVPLRCNPEKVLPSYLAYFLRSSEFLNFANTVVAGAKMPRMVMSEFWRYPVPTPPLSEQRRIAAILDKADALRTKRREALAQLDRLAQSIFVDMFGDPVSNSRGWDQASFEQFFLDKTSSCEKLPSSGYQGEGVFPVIDQGQAAIAGFCDDESLLAEVALPVTLFGDHTRTVKHVNFPFVVGADGAKVLKAVEWVNPRFASHLLANLPIPNLGYSRHMKEVKRLTFIVPPRVLQDSFEIRLTALDKVRVQHQRAALSSDFLSESLQHRAFRGEIR